MEISEARHKAATALRDLERVKLFAAKPEVVEVAEAIATAATARATALAKEYRTTYKLKAITFALDCWKWDLDAADESGDNTAVMQCQLAMAAVKKDYDMAKETIVTAHAKAAEAEERADHMDRNPLYAALRSCALLPPSEPVIDSCGFRLPLHVPLRVKERGERGAKKRERRLARFAK